MCDQAIEVINLTKVYKGGKQAVNDVSFSVKRGEFFAFLGPNGAGKSTTIKILTTLMKPTSGTATIGGCDLVRQENEIRSKIGVALQTTAIDPMLTGRELIALQGRLYGFSSKEAFNRASELVELVNLTDDANRTCGKYSGGMQRRLDLALSLVHRPEILFLDEPTSGLDPVNRIELWKEITKLNREQGTTIFLTTQYLDEADQLADRVCIINEGSIVALEDKEKLKRSLALDTIFMSFANMQENEGAKYILKNVGYDVQEEKKGINLYVGNGEEHLPAIIKIVSTAGLYPKNISISSPKLDDVFLHLTRKQIKNESPEVI